MSLLQIDGDDALRHWLARHNVSLDFVEEGRTWPLPVARIAGLLVSSRGADGGVGCEDEISDLGSRNGGCLGSMCNSGRTRQDPRNESRHLPLSSVIAKVMEDVVPGVTTYFDREYVRSRPDVLSLGSDDVCDPIKGAASLLVLLPVEPPDLDVLADLAWSEPQHVPHDDCMRDSIRMQTASELVGDGADSDESLSVSVPLALSNASSDATLYDIAETEGDSEISIEVEIHDDAELALASASADLDRAPSNPDPPGDECWQIIPPKTPEVVASLDTEYDSESHSHTSASPSPTCSSQASPRSPSCQGSPRSSSSASDEAPLQLCTLQRTLYDDTSALALQQHLLPSPFYERPLAPLLCVADERDIVQLMCSALHQRHALGLDDMPVVGILAPRAQTSTRGRALCEVLFGWIESQVRAGHTLCRAHIVAMKHDLSKIAPTHNATRATLFDMGCPESAQRLARFIGKVGPHLQRIASRRNPSPHQRPSCAPVDLLALAWRADTYVEKIVSRDRGHPGDARIALWAHEVWCCNQGDSDDETDEPGQFVGLRSRGPAELLCSCDWRKSVSSESNTSTFVTSTEEKRSQVDTPDTPYRTLRVSNRCCPVLHDNFKSSDEPSDGTSNADRSVRSLPIFGFLPAFLR
ncbi:hypothetical protein C8Q76DRAFT_707850 [Earliella scabrosa]|nr:hypothetical protein C8Q76DRAFT_707850 [Earliella scabrosa]